MKLLLVGAKKGPVAMHAHYTPRERQKGFLFVIRDQSSIRPPREKQKRVAPTLPHLTLGLSRAPGLTLSAVVDGRWLGEPHSSQSPELNRSTFNTLLLHLLLQGWTDQDFLRLVSTTRNLNSLPMWKELLVQKPIHRTGRLLVKELKFH